MKKCEKCGQPLPDKDPDRLGRLMFLGLGLIKAQQTERRLQHTPEELTAWEEYAAGDGGYWSAAHWVQRLRHPGDLERKPRADTRWKGSNGDIPDSLVERLPREAREAHERDRRAEAERKRRVAEIQGTPGKCRLLDGGSDPRVSHSDPDPWTGEWI